MFLLISNFILSCIFWCNPIKHNVVHKLDGFMAKISFALFSLYIVFIKQASLLYKLAYIVHMSLTLFFFIISDYYSNKEWCCDNHIYMHLYFHIMIAIGIMYAFTIVKGGKTLNGEIIRNNNNKTKINNILLENTYIISKPGE